MISHHYNDPLAKHFRIDKTQGLVAKKYDWAILHLNVETYVQEYDVCLASKVIHNKPYRDLQLLLLPIQYGNNLLMNFVIGLLLFTNWKGNSYDSIHIIVDRLTKIVFYELVKVTIDAPGLAKVIINIVIQYHDLPDSIINDWGAIFTSEFWSLLYCFLGIKHWLSIEFIFLTDR